MWRWLIGLLVLTGCGVQIEGPEGAFTAQEAAQAGYMPFVWHDANGIAFAREIIAPARRNVQLSGSRRTVSLLPNEPFVSHPSAVTLAGGHTLMHAIVRRDEQFRIAQIEDPFGEARHRVLPLTREGGAVAPFALRVDETLYLCWTKLMGNQARLQLTQSSDGGRSWERSQDLARGQIGRMALLPDGRLWIVYQTQPADGGVLEIFSLVLDPKTGQVTPPRQITHLSNSHDPWPWIHQGRRHLAFAGSRGEPFQIYETTSRDGTDWAPPRALTNRPACMHVQPHVLPLPDGRTLWTWGEGTYPNGPFTIRTGFDL